MSGFTFDSGALIALERRDPRVAKLARQLVDTRTAVTIPATVLAQVLRSPARQVYLTRLLAQPTTTTQALDRHDAALVGQLLAATRTSDIADAHVAVCARRARQVVVTSDPADLARLDPDLTLIRV